MAVRYMQASPIIKISRQPRTFAGRAVLLLLRFVFGLAKTVHFESGINPFIRIVIMPIRCNDTISLCFGPDLEFEVPISDPYWMHVALSGQYEPDIYWFIRSLKQIETLFIDCGANIGWWSLIANTSLCWNVIAIEAASHLVERIKINASNNRSNFTVLQRAVWFKAGEVLQFSTSTGSHAGGHISAVSSYVSDSRLSILEKVETTTIDNVVSGAMTKEIKRVIIKIDVEGAEDEAFAGAKSAIKNGALVIYEDHGSDATCKASVAAFKLGCVVYSLPLCIKSPCRSISEIRQVKRKKSIGYNFIAVNPDFEHFLTEIPNYLSIEKI